MLISSVVRAFAHGPMGRRIDPSWGWPIEFDKQINKQNNKYTNTVNNWRTQAEGMSAWRFLLRKLDTM